MSLDSCTPGQRATIETLSCPLMVMAGAGSGKTFTLTQRIVNAFTSGGEQGQPFLTSINQVLAITFTNKAAAELRARIKEELFTQGFTQAALEVDDSWISTIHGMASRILREHALDLGLDPVFEIISEAQQIELRTLALEQTIQSIEESEKSEDERFQAYLSSARLQAASARSRGVYDIALDIIARTDSMPQALDGIVTLLPDRTPADIMRSMIEWGEQFSEAAALWQKPGKYESTYLAELQVALEAAEEWMASSAKLATFDNAQHMDEFKRVFYAFPPTSEKFHMGKPDGAFFADYRAAYAELSDEVRACIGAVELEFIVRLAQLSAHAYHSLKGPARLDNADLLRLCAQALQENPHLAQRYRQQFKLIMVDEFQDTDKLQTAVIASLAAPDLSNVCVVGDAQQSIYRFRGADVNVFFDYAAMLENNYNHAKFPELADNFRSHGDVLALVDAIFSQGAAFGSRFLRLSAAGKPNTRCYPLFESGEVPRIKLDMVHRKRGARNSSGVSADKGIIHAARNIAAHFADLRARGAKPHEFALLLGGMSNAHVFAEALREVGLESVVVGGSVFAEASEVHLVSALLHYAHNTSDETSLLSILISPLFALSDDVLLALTTRLDENNQVGRRALRTGFADMQGEQSASLIGKLSANDRAALEGAKRMLHQFTYAARKVGVTFALRQLLTHTGYLVRLENRGTAGFAAAGNLAKALRLVEDFEGKAQGIVDIEQMFDSHIQFAKEAPGVLAGGNTEFVRIMTVHASKGLQFTHVAVADLKNGTTRASRILTENIGESTYVAMMSPVDDEFENVLDKLRKFPRSTSSDDVQVVKSPGALVALLKDVAEFETRSEAQRLLYVALTRAVESVYLSYVTSSNPENEYVSDGIYHEVYTALNWDTAAKHSISHCNINATLPAVVTLTYLQPEDFADESDDGENVIDPHTQTLEAPFLVPLYPNLPSTNPQPYHPERDNVHSYSSLSHSDTNFKTEKPSEQALEREVLTYEQSEDATALGTAFHRLAERAIVLASAQAPSSRTLEYPDAEAVQAQIAKGNLSESQAKRLQAALDLWFGSEVATRFAKHTDISAEVPFMVRINNSFFLEGEIDGLATNGDRHAFLIDYKTGGYADETAEQLHEKHKLQAQCYAYALMDQGFTSVEAHFVRVEQPDATNPTQPQCIDYTFSLEHMDELKTYIARE